MIPISADNPRLRAPLITIGLLLGIAWVWLDFQRAGFSSFRLAESICNWGLVAGELTLQAAEGTAVPLGPGLACVVDREWSNVLTPLSSMFLHGGWGHVAGNMLFLWVFGSAIEDSMGRLRFGIFYLACGLVAALAQVLVDPGSPVPMVGASGAVSGVMGGYLLLYPRVRIKLLVFLLIFITVVSVPAWLVLLYWLGLQLLMGLPELAGMGSDMSGGVAVWAHVGGFAAGLLLIKLFARRELTGTQRQRTLEKARRRSRAPS
jgi:membrane associated rhomboid family serine protease